MIDRIKLIKLFNIFLLVVPVVIDFFNGLIFFVAGADISIGAMYRLALMGITLPYVILATNKLIKIWCTLLVVSFCMSWLVWNSYADFIDLKSEFEFLARIMFPYFLLAYFLYIQEKYIFTFDYILGTMVWFGVIGGGLLVFSLITGIGILSYDIYSYGVQSFFIAVNDIGLVLLISFAAAMYRMMAKISLIRVVIAFTIFGGLLATGTRTGSAGAAGVFLVFILAPMFYGKNNVKMSSTFKAVFLGILFFILVGGLKVGYDIIQKYPYMLQKFEVLGEGESARYVLEKAATERIENRPMLLQVFGEGSFAFHKYVELGVTGGKTYSHGKLVEQDILDFLGSYGLITGLLMLGFPVSMLIINGINFLRNGRKFRDMAICVMLTLFIFHSFTAGHALNSPTVSTAIVVAYFYVFGYKKIKQDEKFIRDNNM